MLRLLPALLVLALMIYAFVDCLNTPEEEVRGLPKMVWFVVILVFGEVLVGPLAWLFVGRRPVPAGGGDLGRGAGRGPGPGAGGGPGAGWVAPDDNPEFLNSLKAGGTPAAGSRDGVPAAGDAAAAGDAPAAGARDERDEELLKEWEADLRRREEELRRRERGEEPGDV